MGHHPNHPQHHQHSSSKKTSIHKDWRTWTVVILMLFGMLVYLATMEERVGPDGEQQAPMAAE